MDILSPLILLHENGYKAFTKTAASKDLRLPMVEVQDKIPCLAEGDVEDAGSAALVGLEPAVQSTVESLRKAAENAVAGAAKTVRGNVGASGAVRDRTRRPEDRPKPRHGNNLP